MRLRFSSNVPRERLFGYSRFNDSRADNSHGVFTRLDQLSAFHDYHPINVRLNIIARQDSYPLSIEAPTNRQTRSILVLPSSFYLQIKEGRRHREIIARNFVEGRSSKLTPSRGRTRSLRRGKFSSPWPPTRPAPTANRSRNRRIFRASSARRPLRSLYSSTLKKAGAAGETRKKKRGGGRATGRVEGEVRQAEWRGERKRRCISIKLVRRKEGRKAGSGCPSRITALTAERHGARYETQFPANAPR